MFNNISLPNMPFLITEETDFGEVFFSWEVPEYEQYKRSKRWYWVFVPLGVFFILTGIFTDNFLFSLIIILFAIILFMQSFQKPPMVDIKVTDLGVAIGGRFYPYREIKEFFIVYDPPEVKSLYIRLNNVLKPIIKITLPEVNPIELRQALRAYVFENTEVEEEPILDKITRNFLLE